jgi:uncharacterized protein with HEPN domain
MTKQLALFHAEVIEAMPLLDKAISEGVDSFSASLYERAVVDSRIYRIAEWSLRLSDLDKSRVPGERWHALRSLRNVIAHRFETLDPALMFVFAAMNVPKLEFALRKALREAQTP